MFLYNTPDMISFALSSVFERTTEQIYAKYNIYNNINPSTSTQTNIYLLNVRALNIFRFFFLLDVPYRCMYLSCY